MIKTFYLSIFILLCSANLIIISCRNNGLFGHSESKEEAKSNGSTVSEYVPNKVTFNLLDGTKMQIDTAWTELSFTYRNGVRILDSTYGFHFGIPYNIMNEDNFTFNFYLADTTNRIFTNGREKKVCYLYPRMLYNKMKVILEQKNPDISKGWLQPIITDTIIFYKIE